MCVHIVCAALVIPATPRLYEGVRVAEVEEVNACALQSDKRGESKRNAGATEQLRQRNRKRA